MTQVSKTLQNNFKYLFRKDFSPPITNITFHERDTVSKIESFKDIDGQYVKNKVRAYIWGGGQYGALGNPSIIGRDSNKVNVKVPLHIHFANKYKINKIACGFGFTLFSSNHKVLGSGINTCSQIGFHEPRKNSGQSLQYIYSPVKLNLPHNCDIFDVSAGEGHSLILTDRGVYSLGNNEYGQCGRQVIPNESYSNNRLVYNIPTKHFDSQVTKVHCNSNTSYFLTSKGSIYSCGHGLYGQVGNGTFNETNSIPTKIAGPIVDSDLTAENLHDRTKRTLLDKNLSKITYQKQPYLQLPSDERFIKIAGRTNTMLALTSKGRLFGWGACEHQQFLAFTTPQMNNNFFSHSSPNISEPLHLNFDPETSLLYKNPTLNLNGITKLREIVGSPSSQIIDCAATDTMCAFIEARSGTVWVWGVGPIGTGPEKTHSVIPLQIPAPIFGRTTENEHRVIRIEGGAHHFIAQTAAGEIFTWGSNINGALGLGKDPLQISEECQTEDWKFHKDIGDKRHYYCFPHQVSLMANRIMHISAGYDHSALISKA